MIPVQRPLRADAVRNRRQLLDAARDLFARDGVNASLDDIARAAGVGPGTLYRHFATRDRLVLELIDEGLAETHDLGVTLLDGPDPLRALHRWLASYIDQASVFKGLAATLANPPTSDGHDSCRRTQAAGAALVDRAITAGLVRVDVGVADVLDMAAAIAWIGEQTHRTTSQRDKLLDLLVDGLRSAAQERRTG
jgi:AcrR family transcriptional regulator